MIAAYAMNSYLWKLLQDKHDLSVNDYGGRIPIIPGGQEQDFEVYDKPFITYGWSISPYNDLYVHNNELMSYMVYSTSMSTIGSIMETVNEAMRSMDSAGANITSWIHSDNNTLKDNFIDLNFTFASVVALNGPNPPQTEGGKADGNIVIRYRYTKTNDPSAFKYR